MTLIGIEPRDYQLEIFNTCKDKSCLVVIPTGIGKTLIGLMLAVHRLKEHPDMKVVFLAPTKPLVEQHLRYFRDHLPELFATLEIFTGATPAPQRKKLWQRADIVFSTPQCIANDIRKSLYNLSDVCLLVEDEAHRCIKNYDYTFIARHFNNVSSSPHVLGLTASPGSDKKKIMDICKNLGVEALEVRTRDSSDVKPFLQELKRELVFVDFPQEFLDISALLNQIFLKKIQELKNRHLLFRHPSKVALLELQKSLMVKITKGVRDFQILAGASTTAQALKISHALELLETQTLAALSFYYQSLFTQASSKKSKAVQNLIKIPEFNASYTLTQELLSQGKEHPKLFRLKGLVRADFESGIKRVIVFTQFRDSAVRICRELNSLPLVNASVFVGQAKKKVGSADESGLSQKEQKLLINNFVDGKLNVLVSTSIGEEGLDIPEVGAVYFYEPIPSAIRKIQRGGRTARLMPGKIVTLITKGTRDEAYHWSAFQKEKKMSSALDSVKDDFDNPKKKFGVKDKNLNSFSNKR